MAKEVLAAAQVTSFSNFYSGDPYIGTRVDELKKKNDEIASLQKEVKQLKLELSRAQRSYGGNSRQVVIVTLDIVLELEPVAGPTTEGVTEGTRRPPTLREVQQKRDLGRFISNYLLGKLVHRD